MEDTPVALPAVSESAERDAPLDAPLMDAPIDAPVLDAPDSAIVLNG